MTRECSDTRVRVRATLAILASLSLLAGVSGARAEGDYVTSRYTNSGFSALKDLSSKLFDNLADKDKKQISPLVCLLETNKIPVIKPEPIQLNGRTGSEVIVSTGCIDLINRVAHAKAIDDVRPGYFDRYVATLGDNAGDVKELPDIADDKCWTEDVLNEQVSYFNQMVGILVALNLSHQYLGHCAKYSAQLSTASTDTAFINDFVTSSEWDKSMKAATTDSMGCALGTQGYSLLLDAFGKMNRRPVWADHFVPKKEDLAKVKKRFAGYEKDFFNQ